MCSECYKQFCPDACPSSTLHSFSVCEDCGNVLEGCIAYRGHDGNLYCMDCIEGMDTDEILRVCGVNSVSDLLIRINGNEKECGKKGMVFISAES